MKLHCAFLLLQLGSALSTQAVENDVTKHRRVDVVETSPPTPAPTESPTRAPSPKPTPAPTVSQAPSTSLAPSTPRATACANDGGPNDWCYDGTGSGGGKGYTTCYAYDDDEFCGETVFSIVGVISPNDPAFPRCSDVYPWMLACVESYGCQLQSNPGKLKRNGSPNRHVRYLNNNKKWEFKLHGGRVTKDIKWLCDEKEDADGMKHFYDQLALADLYTTPSATCTTPSPTVSLAPTASPAPTLVPSPQCNSTGLTPFTYVGGNVGRYWISALQGIPDKGKITFTGLRTCELTITGAEIDGVIGGIETFDHPFELMKRAAELAGCTVTTEETGSLTGETAPSKNIATTNYDHPDPNVTGYGFRFKWEGLFMSWSAPTSDIRKKVVEVFGTAVVGQAARFWLKGGDLQCGDGPFCYDDKSNTMCYIDPNSHESCGPFDFVVKGLDYESRTGDSYEWFKDCTSHFGCTRWTPTDFPFPYTQKVNGNAGYWGGKEFWYFMLKHGGMQKTIYECPDEAAARGMNAFYQAAKYSALFAEEPFECTDSPTTSPTACTDSFLTNPPLNIGIVIDTSFSAYRDPFESETSIGDVNNDGKPDTILDAEIAAVLELLENILVTEELDNSNVDIGIVVFDTEAFYTGRYSPLSDDNTELNEQLVADLRGIRTVTRPADVNTFNRGFTNFDDALDKAIMYFNDEGVDTSRTNLMVFLSDGKPNVRGDGDDEEWCPETTVNCTNAPDNDGNTDPAWEAGSLSYCLFNSTECYDHPFKDCALGVDSCQGKGPAKNYVSELQVLDDLKVHRLSIGVGLGSDVSINSGLYMIDNNPLKITLGVLPRQVFNSDDLMSALRDLCPENTPNPTERPSMPPSTAPTVSPTAGPTDVPSDTPTGTPSQTPTADYCEYNEIDFKTTASGDDTGTGAVPPGDWRAYGLRITAITAERGEEYELPSPAFFYPTGDAEAGKTLIVQQDDTVGTNPVMNPTGGDIIITLDQTQDKFMEIDLFNVVGGAMIGTYNVEGESLGDVIDIEDFENVKSFLVGVNGAYQVVISFQGTGALAQLNVCRDPNRTPSPVGLAPPTETSEPTPSPTDKPGEPTAAPVETDEPTVAPVEEEIACPADVPKLIDTVGGTGFDSLPIKIISQDTSSVTFEVTNTFSNTVAYLYTRFHEASRFNDDCYEYENVDESWTQTFTAKCMDSTPLSIVEVVISDPSLSEVLDTAKVPECCHAPIGDDHPKVTYIFQLMCTPQCPITG